MAPACDAKGTFCRRSALEAPLRAVLDAGQIHRLT
jgi:hypothetical protein